MEIHCGDIYENVKSHRGLSVEVKRVTPCIVHFRFRKGPGGYADKQEEMQTLIFLNCYRRRREVKTRKAGVRGSAHSTVSPTTCSLTLNDINGGKNSQEVLTMQYSVYCSNLSCGCLTTVPFQPTPGRLVYCQNCMIRVPADAYAEGQRHANTGQTFDNSRVHKSVKDSYKAGYNDAQRASYAAMAAARHTEAVYQREEHFRQRRADANYRELDRVSRERRRGVGKGIHYLPGGGFGGGSR